MLLRRICCQSYLVGAFFSLKILAERAPDVDERLLDVEAQVATLKTDLDATKSLAEQERPSAFNPSISVIFDVLGQHGINVPALGQFA